MRDHLATMVKQWFVAWLDELLSLQASFVVALIPAFVLSRMTLPFTWFPALGTWEWVKVQMLVYFCFRIYLVQKKASR